jgi:hypothetical protein
MIALMTSLALAAAAAPATGDTVTDRQIAAFDAKRFDPYSRDLPRELGVHHGVRVVVAYPCSDVCPRYTKRIVHYDLPPGPECAKIGGVDQDRVIPRGIGVKAVTYCVPAVLAKKPAP